VCWLLHDSRSALFNFYVRRACFSVISVRHIWQAEPLQGPNTSTTGLQLFDKVVTLLVDALCYKFEGRGFDSWWGYCSNNWPNPSSRSTGLDSTQLQTEISTRNIPGGGGRRAAVASLPPVSRMCSKCESLDVLKPYGPPWPAVNLVRLLCMHGRHQVCFLREQPGNLIAHSLLSAEDNFHWSLEIVQDRRISS
jgi:hypothetical protein